MYNEDRPTQYAVIRTVNGLAEETWNARRLTTTNVVRRT